MFKQILKKLPRKSSKTGDNREHGRNSVTHSIASTSPRSSDLGKSKSGNFNIVSPQVNDSASDAVQNYVNRIQLGVNLQLNGNSVLSSFDPLPALKDVPSAEKHSLFIKKLNLCCFVFDFTNPTKNLKEKELKRQMLLELVDYLTSANGKFNETVMQEAVKMVSANLFRALTPQPGDNKIADGVDLEEEEPSMDPAWPHLQLVYEFLLRLVASPETDAKLAKRYID